MLLFGPPGGGKSHLGSAIGLSLLEKGWRPCSPLDGAVTGNGSVLGLASAGPLETKLAHTQAEGASLTAAPSLRTGARLA